jgi:tetratricopeptide (TPR) repeat protein
LAKWTRPPNIDLYLRPNLIPDSITRMENKIKRDPELINLVADFEVKFEKGEVGYIDEKVYFQLLEYYEDEYLLDKALEVVDHALQHYTYRSEFYIVKARLLLNLNRVDDCLAILDQASSIAPFEREISIVKVRALAAKKNFYEAQLLLDDLKIGATKSDKVEILIAESFIQEYLKDYSAMYDALAKALLLETNNEEALERVWISAELSRRYEDSVALHKEIIERDPYNYLAWYNLGHGYNCIWEYEKALEALEYSFIINPEFESGYLDCADTCLQIKMYDKALEVYIDANRRFGPNTEIMVNVAHCYIYLDQIPTAKQWLLKSIKLDGYNDEAYFLLGECYAREGVWYNAINAYHKAIDIENRREEYYLGLAKAYVAVEDYNKATVNFQFATETGPEDTLYWKEYACFLIKLGLHEEALGVLNEAEEHTYGCDLIYSRAVVNFLLQNKMECLEMLEEALMEDYEQHRFIFDLAPEMRLSKEINAMIKYYQDNE